MNLSGAPVLRETTAKPFRELPIEDRRCEFDEHGPIFIYGCPRSGTTFLAECIGGLPRVEQFTGVLAPPRMMHLVASAQPETREALLQVVKDVFWHGFTRKCLFADERLKRVRQRDLSPLSFLREHYGDRALSVHARARFAYKEPFLAFCAQEFADFFPTAHFVHIIRDGRDAADSLERTYPHALSDQVLRNPVLADCKSSEIGPTRPWEGWLVPWWVPAEESGEFVKATRYGRCIRLWREMVERGRRPAATHPARYHELRYEEFVRRPRETFVDLSERLGIRELGAVGRRLRKATTSSVGIGGRNQGAERLCEAERIAGPLLRKLGYLEGAVREAGASIKVDAPPARTPEISVVMGVRNGGQRLAGTIESILSQEQVDLEFVIVDDGSTDATPEVLAGYAARDARVRVLRQEHAGLTRALIAGCAAARGEFIARQDVADYSLPGRLRKQADLLRGEPGLAFVGCGCEVFAPRGEIMSVSHGESAERATARLRELAAHPLTLLQHGSAMFRKRSYEAAGGYRRQFFYAQDLDLWTRLSETGGLAYVPDLLYRGSFHYASISAGKRQIQERLREIIIACTRVRRAGGSEAALLERAAAEGEGGGAGATRGAAAYFVGRCLMNRRDPRARDYFREALAADHLHLKALVRLAQSAVSPMRAR